MNNTNTPVTVGEEIPADTGRTQARTRALLRIFAAVALSTTLFVGTPALLSQLAGTGSTESASGSITETVTSTGSLQSETGSALTSLEVILNLGLDTDSGSGTTLGSIASTVSGTGSLETASGELVIETETGAVTQNESAIIVSTVESAGSEPTNISPRFSIPADKSIASRDDLQESLRGELLNSSGVILTPTLNVTDGREGYEISVVAPTSFEPGTYTLRLMLGVTRGIARFFEQLFGFVTDDQVLLEQQVRLGTIAVNTDKAMYAPGDEAELHIALLEATALCQTNVTVTVRSPNGTEAQYATGSGSLTLPAACTSTSAGAAPGSEDFTIAIPLPTAGEYGVTVAAGTEAVSMVFTATETQPRIAVKRSGVTQAAAGSVREMTITVFPHEGFTGLFEETVPAGIVIESTIPPAEVSTVGDETRVTWRGRFDAGTPATLRYSYTVPSESPRFSIFGPLEMSGTFDAIAPAETISEEPETVENEPEPTTSTGAVTGSGEILTSSGILAPVPETGTAAILPSMRTETESGSGASSESTSEPTAFVRNRLLSQIFGNDDLAMTDFNRWQLLSTGKRNHTPQSGTGVLSLTALKSGFEAKEAATFRILDAVGDLPADADGVLSESTALGAIVHATTDSASIEREVTRVLIANDTASIAEKMTDESLEVNVIREALGDDAGSVRRSEIVTSTVTDTIDEKITVQERLADIAAEDPAVQAAITEATTPEVRAAVVDAAIAKALGNGTDDSAVLAAIADTGVSQNTIADALGGNAEAIESIGESITGTSAADEAIEPLITVTLQSKGGQSFTPKYSFQKGSVILVLEPDREFTPGIYTLTVIIRNPLTGEERTLTQDFAWGVLAMNSNQDRYEPGDQAKIDFGVLDDTGEIVCDAHLTLEVTSPSGEVLTLSTDDDSIRTLDTCGQKIAGNIDPDYQSFFTPTEVGEYALHLVAVTPNGERSLDGELLIEEDPAFIIERTAATRLWPFAPSPMTVSVRFREQYTGSIVDTVPSGFTIVDTSPNAVVTETGSGKTLVWSGSWSAGETATFSYQYDAPDISPQFYLAGPLKIGDAEEGRAWQIANDASNLTIIGTVYDSDGYTALTSKTVAVSLNGAVAAGTNDTTATGSYTITGLTMTGGTIVSVYLDGETEKGVTATLGSGGSIRNLDIRRDYLTVRSDSGSVAMTNPKLRSAALNADTDIAAIYSVSATNGLQMAYGKNLHVWTGDAFTPGGKVWAFNFTNSGTVTMSTNTLVVSGSLISTNTLNSSTGTILISKLSTNTLKLTSGSLQDVIMDSGLVGYWKLDDGAGLTARDSSSKKRGATLSGGAAWSGTTLTTRLGYYNPYGIRLDGVDDTVSAAGFTNIVGAMSMWFKPDSTITSSSTCETLFTSNLTADGLSLSIGSCTIFSEVEVITIANGANSRTMVSGITINPTWNHIVMSWNGSAYQIYLNGTNLSTYHAANPAQQFKINSYARFGSFNSNGYFAGAIDDLRIYEYGISATAVNALYNGNKAIGSGTYVLASNLTVPGNLNIYGSALDTSGSNYSVNVAGNANIQGDFTKQSSTFTLNGSGNQTLSGSTVFNNLTATASSARTLFLDHTSRQSISGALVLQGATSNLLSLRSTLSGSGERLLLDATSGTQTIDHLDVKDSNASGGAELECSSLLEACVNSGNNTNWAFFPYDVSGTVYSDAGSTALASATIALSINGAPASTTSANGSGQFTFSNVEMTGSTVLSLYISGGATKGVTATIASGTTLTGINIYGDHLIVRSESGSAIMTNSRLKTAAANGSTDISGVYSVDSSSNLNMGYAKTLYVWSGDSFTPGGKVLTYNLTNAGTIAMSTNTLVASGSLISTGTLNSSTGTILKSTETSKTLTVTSGTLTNLTIDNGLVGYWKMDDGVGTIARDSSSFRNHGTLTAGPVWSGSSLTTRLTYYNPSGLRLDGTDDYVTTTNAGQYQFGTGDFSIALWVKPRVLGNPEYLVSKYTVASKGYILAIGTASKATGYIASDAPTVTGASTLVAGNWYHLALVRRGGTAQIFVNGAVDATATGIGANVASSTNALLFGRIIEDGDFVHGAIDDIRMYNRALSISEVAALYGGSKGTGSGTYELGSTLTLAGNLNVYGGALDASGSSLTVGGNMNMQGDFIKRSSTVTLNAAGNQMLSGSTIFNNFTTTASSARTLTFDYTSRQSVSGALVLQGASSNLLSLRSSRTGSGSRVLLDATSGTQTIDHLDVKDNNASGGSELSCSIATEACINSGNNTNWAFYPSISGTAFSDGGVTPLVSPTIALSVNGGTASTVSADSSGNFTFPNINMTGGSILSLYVSGGATKGVTALLASGSSLTGIDIYGSRLIVRSESGSIALTNTHLTTAAFNGSSDISDIYTVNSGTLWLKSGMSLHVWDSKRFTPGGGVRVGSGITVDGIFSAGSNTVALSGSWLKTGTGTFTAGTSTVVLDDGTNQTLSGSTTFYNLSKTVTSAATLWFSPGKTQTVTNTLTLQGAASNRLSLRSLVTGTRWIINPQGTRSISYVDVKDSHNTNSTGITCSSGCVDSRNNINWLLHTITGTAYEQDGTTALSAGKIIAASINGGSIAQGNTGATVSGGQYTIAGVNLTGGTIIALHIKGATEKAVTVTLGSGSSMTGMTLRRDTLILRSDSGSVALTNNHLNLADNAGLSDISAIYSVDSSSTLLVQGGKKLLIWTGDSYTPGARVRASDLTVEGTMTMAGNGLTVTGSLVATSGTITSSTGVLLNSKRRSESLTLGSNTLTNLSIDNGLVGYWKLDDGVGAVARDSSSHSHPGTLVNGGSWSGSNLNTRIGFYNPSALKLNGSTQYVEMDSSIGNFGTSPFTASMWVKGGEYATSILHKDVYAGTGNGIYIYVVQPGPDPITYRYWNGSTWGVFGSVDGNWHHLVAVRNSTSTNGVSLYYDGVLVAVLTDSRTLSNAYPLRLGAPNDAGHRFDGSIDDVRLYDRALSAGEVTHLYNGNKNTGSGTYALGGNLTLAGNLNIYGGALDPTALNYSVAVGGNANIQGGFTKRASTFTLSGSGNQTLSGSTVFHNLTATTGSRTVYFDHTSRQSVSGSLVFNGSVGNRLSLRSTRTNSGARVMLDADSSQLAADLQYLNVKDSNASGGQALTCSSLTEGCLSSGNNTNWVFDNDTITGTVYSDEGTTPLSGVTVAVSENGGTATRTALTNGSGQFSVDGLNMTGGTILALYLDGGSSRAATVTVSSGTNLTGVNLYKNRLILRSDSGSLSLTNSHLNIADNSGDTDITSVFSVSNGTLGVGTGRKLLVWTGHTFAPGGNVNAGSGVAIAGTLSLGSNTLTLSGSWVKTGTFSAGTSTVVFEGNGSETITSGGTDSSSDFSTLTISKPSGTLTLATNAVSGATINVTAGTYSPGALATTAAALVINGGTYTKGAGALTTDSFTLSSGTYDSNAQTTTIRGLATLSGGTYLASTALQTMSGGLFLSGGTYTGSTGGLNVDGNITLSSGTFTAPSGTFTVSGNWTKRPSATFTAGSSTVTLNGTDQTMTGSTTFTNLTKVASSNQTLTFGSGSTQTISSTLTFTGTSLATLSLRSSHNGSRWKIDPQGTRTVGYLDVRDSQNINATNILCSTSCTDSGNNIKWGFYSISGTVYTDAGTTNIGAGKDVSVSLNGGPLTASGTTNASGQFTIGGLSMSGGTIVTVYLDNEVQKAVTVTLSAGANMSSVDLYQNYLIARSDSGSVALTNSYLKSAALNGDTDITDFYSVTGSDLTVSGTKTLLVWTGDTFRPGGTVALTDVEVFGTLAMNASSLTVSGSFSATGIFTSSGTTIFDSADTENIASDGNHFQDVIFNNATGQWYLSDNFSVSGSLIVERGAFNSNSNKMTVRGLTTASGGTYSFQAGLQTFSGGLVVSGGTVTGASNGNALVKKNFTLSSGAFNPSGAVTTISGSALLTGGTYTASTARQAFGSGFTLAGGTYTGSTGPMTVTGSVTLNSGTFTAPTSVVLTRNWTKRPGATFTAGTSNVRLKGNANTLSGSTTFYNLTKTGGTLPQITFVAGSTQTITNALALSGSNLSNLLTLRSSTDGTSWNINPQGTRSVTYLDVKDSTNTNLTAILCAVGCTDSDNNVNWSFPFSGTVYSDAGTTAVGAGVPVAVSINGAAADTFTTDSSGRYTATIETSSGDTLAIYRDDGVQQALTVRVSDGKTHSDMDLYRNTLIVRSENGSPIANDNLGIADNNGDTDITDFYAITGNDLTVAGTKTLHVWTGKTYYSSGAVAVTDIVVRGTLQMDDNLLTVSGSFDASSGGAFSTSGSTVFDSSSLETIASNGSKFQNVTFNNAAGQWNLSDRLSVSGALLIQNGTLDVLGKSVANRGGTFTNSGTLRVRGNETFTNFTNDDNSGRTVYYGSGSYVGLSGLDTFYHLTLSGSGLWTLNTAITASGTLTLSGGTLDVSSSNYAITVRKNWVDTISGDQFTPRKGTVTFAGSGSITSNEPFWSVTMNSPSAMPQTVATTLDLDGSLRLQSGTLSNTLGSYALTLSGSWIDGSGAYLPGTGTVTLDGRNQTLSGSTTFYNLTKTTASAETLTFGAGKTVTVSGSLLFQGATSNLLSLRSSVTGTQWKINPGGTRSVTYVDVKDSNNTNATVLLCSEGCSNSGNNTNWSFPITVVAYTNSGTTLAGAGRSVSISINGGTKVTKSTNGSSVASFTGSVLSSGSLLTAWYDDDVSEGVTVTTTNDTNLSFDLYKDYLYLASDNGEVITSTTLNTANNANDTDIDAVYVISGSVLTVQQGKTLRIRSDTIFRPGMETEVDDIEIAGTFHMDGNTVTVHGSWDATGGTFTGTNTVVFDSQEEQTITSDGNAFNNATFVVTGSGSLYTTTDALDVNGTQTVQNPDGETDNDAPVISNVSAAPVTDTSAAITWETNESATSVVLYGTDSGNLDQRSANAKLDLNHARILTGLSAETTYYFKVASTDIAGNTATGSVLSFTTAETGEESQGGGGAARPKDECSFERSADALLFSDIAVETADDGTALVRWKTNGFSLSLVQYGTGSATEFREYSVTDFVQDHEVKLSNLYSKTGYKFQVGGVNRCGIVKFAEAAEFLSGLGKVKEELHEAAEEEPLTESGALAEIERLTKELTPESFLRMIEIIAALEGKLPAEQLKPLLDLQQISIAELAKRLPAVLFTGEPRVAVTDTTATVTWTTDQQTNSQVSYATEATYRENLYQQTSGNATERVTAHTVTLLGLTPGTRYHFKLRGQTALGIAGESPDFTFVTLQGGNEITSYASQILSPTSARFTWRTRAPSETAVTVTPYQDGRLATEIARTVTVAGTGTDHTVTVTGLEPVTFYDVELWSRGGDGRIASKTIARFVTSEEGIPLEVSGVQTQSALLPGKDGRVQAVVTWSTNISATSRVLYQQGIAASAEVQLAESTPETTSFTRKHVVVLTNLEPGEIYSFRVASEDANDNAVLSGTYTILTPRQEESVFQVILRQIEAVFGWVGKLRN